MRDGAKSLPVATGSAVIVDETGLHARPAVKLTRLAKTFASAIEIRPDSQEKWVNAKSPNAVMKLRAAHGEQLQIRAEGEDSQEGVDALVSLIDNNFND